MNDIESELQAISELVHATSIASQKQAVRLRHELLAGAATLLAVAGALMRARELCPKRKFRQWLVEAAPEVSVQDARRLLRLVELQHQGREGEAIAAALRMLRVMPGCHQERL
ncbi:MAG TPA: hypothetical protein PKM73_18845 [Verrucomicrobiota bacterium]|nr:hypothetical protein [Verrucomicrobiota bacterium]